MKEIETKAIVLSSLKYGDTSLIVRCYTEQLGLKSFIAKGVFSKKKRNTALYLKAGTRRKAAGIKLAAIRS